MPDYKFHWSGMNGMTLEGDHLFAVVQSGGKDISTIDEGLSVVWYVCAIIKGGGMSDCRAKGEITFTNWENVEAEYQAAKRLAKSTLVALEKPLN